MELLDLRTGELRQHDPGDFITMSTGVEYPTTQQEPELWLRTLEDVFLGNAEMIVFFKRMCGVALCGHVQEHIVLINYGVGGNGKSVVWGAVRGAMGDYAISANQELLMATRQQSHSTNQADLFRVRLAEATESDDGARFNEAVLKRLTGGDTIRARRMREDNFEFEPSHLLVLSTNHRPEVKGTDNGVWRRIRLLPFEAVITPKKQDKRLPEKLKAEYPAILQWMADGCLEWQEMGLNEPPEVMAATDQYRAEQDILGQFVSDRCMVGTNYRVKCANLYDAYKAWGIDAGEKTENSRKFKTGIVDRGFECQKSGTNWYIGITLNE